MYRGSITLLVFLLVCGGIVLVEGLDLRGGRLIELLLLFALAVCAAWGSRGWLRNVAVVASSVMLGLAVLQVLIPLLFPKLAGGTGRASVNDDRLIAARDILGWGARRPGVFHMVKTAADGRVVFDAHATIDQALHRKTVPSDGPRPIVFVGDSFVFGDGVDDDGTLPQAFADLNNGKIPVLNLGFSGWAPSQNLAALQMEPYKSELVAPRRMILFTALFQVERTACKGAFALGSGPRYVLDGDAVRYAGSCAGSRPRWVASTLQFLRGLVLGQDAAIADKVTARDVETYIKIIEAFTATARRDKNAGTTVLMDAGGDIALTGTGWTQAKIVERLRRDGVDVLVKDWPPDGQEALYQIRGDKHPTALANRATARQLQAHLRIVDPHALQTDDSAGN